MSGPTTETRWLRRLAGAAILGPFALATGLTVTAPRWALAAEGGGSRLEIVARAIEYHGGERYRHSETSLELCSGSGCYQMTVRTDGGAYRHEVSGPYRGRTRTVRADNDSVAATARTRQLVEGQRVLEASNGKKLGKFEPLPFSTSRFLVA